MMAAMRRRALAAFVFCLLAMAAGAQVPGLGTYTYDPSGNVTSVGTQTFRYDAFGRVAKATLSPQQEQTYTYDRYGNLQRIDTKLNGVTLQAQQPAVNPCTNRIEVPPPGAAGCTNPSGYNVVGTYDAAGNVLSLEGNSFEYDLLNTTTASTVAGVRRVHLYSASGERVATATMAGGSVQRWDYTLRDASNRVLRRLSQQGGVWRWEEDYIYAGGKLIDAAVRSPEKVLHFHTDHLGTPRLVTGNGGARVTANNYFPFGRELPSAGTSAAGTPPFDDTLKFTGHERDTGTLDYMHARYYAPYLGRFLSVDPTWESADLGKPQSWNRYAYVWNNPVNATDPDGRVLAFGPKQNQQIISFVKESVRYDAIKEVVTSWKFSSGKERLLGVAVLGIIALENFTPTGKGRAATLAANKAAGKAAEAAVARELTAAGEIILGSQVRAETSQGVRIIDHLVENADGIRAVEVKSGNGVRNAEQVAKDAAMAIDGATLTGKHAPDPLKGKKVLLETEVRKPIER
jgi:RHS repeat-associated protein